MKGTRSPVAGPIWSWTRSHRSGRRRWPTGCAARLRRARGSKSVRGSTNPPARCSSSSPAADRSPRDLVSGRAPWEDGSELRPVRGLRLLAGAKLEASKRFVVTGNSRLTVAVARQLSARGGHVTVVDVGGEGTIARRLQADVRPRRRLSLRALLGAAEGRFEPGIHVASSGEDLQASLQAVALAGASCLLALSDHDEENPLVLQTFDPALADQLEQVEREVTVRRAYSVGGLAAPFFVALALGHENIRTMRFGDTELPILRLEVGKSSTLLGETVGSV